MLFCLEKKNKKILPSDVMTCTVYAENLSCANCGCNYQLLNVLCMCVCVYMFVYDCVLCMCVCTCMHMCVAGGSPHGPREGERRVVGTMC